MIQAMVFYDPVRDLLVGTVLPTGATLEAHDAHELADLLFAACVRHGHVSMPDWREGDTAQAKGDKIALNGHLNRVGQAEAAERLALLDKVPVIARNGRPFAVRLSDIPEPWHSEFSQRLRGSTVPVPEDGNDLAFVWDWKRFINRDPWPL